MLPAEVAISVFPLHGWTRVLHVKCYVCSSDDDADVFAEGQFSVQPHSKIMDCGYLLNFVHKLRWFPVQIHGR